MGAEQEARPRPRVLSDVKAEASHLERMWTAAATCVPEIKKRKKRLSHKNASVSAFQKPEPAADMRGEAQKEERARTCSESERLRLRLYSNSDALGGRGSAIPSPLGRRQSRA